MNSSQLGRLWNLAQMHTFSSGGRAAASVLLGLYDGNRFPMKLADLALLIGENRTAALDLISHCTQNQYTRIHALLDSATGRCDFRDRLEHMAWDYGLAGRQRPKKALPPLSPREVTLGSIND